MLLQIWEDFSTEMIPILLFWSKPFDSKHLAKVNFLCFLKSLLMLGSTVIYKYFGLAFLSVPKVHNEIV